MFYRFNVWGSRSRFLRTPLRSIVTTTCAVNLWHRRDKFVRVYQLELNNYLYASQPLLPVRYIEVNIQKGLTCAIHACANAIALDRVFANGITTLTQVDNTETYPVCEQHLPISPGMQGIEISRYKELSAVPGTPIFASVAYIKGCFGVDNIVPRLRELKTAEQGYIPFILQYESIAYPSMEPFYHAITMAVVKPPQESPYLMVLDPGYALGKTAPFTLRSYHRSQHAAIYKLTEYIMGVWK